MNLETEQERIREVINTWMKATSENDVETVLGLMADDVVFLLPGQPPMQGKNAFANASRAMAGKVRFEGTADIQQIEISGNLAFVWNHLSVKVTPLPDGPVKQRAGHVLSVFRKEPDGRWVLYRDANLLTSV